MEAPDFWDDPAVSQEKMKRLKSLKDDVETFEGLKELFEDIETMRRWFRRSRSCSRSSRRCLRASA